MTAEATSLERARGDGGDAPVKDEMLEDLKTDLKEIWTDVTSDLMTRRNYADETRFCQWDGQDPSGQKKREALSGQEPFPFEGASDQRVRTADTIINRRVLFYMAAAFQGLPMVKGMEMGDTALAGKLQTLLRWTLRNQLGRSYRRELEKLVQWMEGDTPAGAILGVFWERETGLEMRQVTVVELVAAAVSQMEGGDLSEGDVEDLAAMFVDPEREEMALGWMRAIVPTISDKTAKRALKELRETGTASFPSAYLRTNMPRLTAFRLLEDIFFPLNTTDLQLARRIYTRELLSEASVREREVSLGWNERFIAGVLEHEGQSCLPMPTKTPVVGDFSYLTNRGEQDLKGLFELFTVYRRAVNDDGVPGIYVCSFHDQVDIPAKDEELLDYAHGQYPFVDFWRETLTQRITDSRGVSELVVADQSALKRQADSFSDHTQLKTVPAIFVPENRPERRLLLGPLKQIKRRKPTDYEWFDGPQYPPESEKERDAIVKRLAEYWGFPAKDVDPGWIELIMQVAVDRFLDSLRMALWMMVQLEQQYMTDEEIARVTGGQGIPIARSREEIQGRFDLDLSFDVRNLTYEFLKLKIDLVGEAAKFDTQGTVMMDRLVSRLFTSIDVNLAEAVLQPVEAANAREIQDEEKNFALIAAGVEPEMQEQGQNFALRMQVLNGIVEKNPDAWEAMTKTSQDILLARLDHLKFQMQQQENARIGRVGSAGALGEGGAR